MFGWGRKDDGSQRNSSKSLSKSRSDKKRQNNGKKRRWSRGRKTALATSPASSASSSLVDRDAMHLAETFSGIEVSLSNEKISSPSSFPGSAPASPSQAMPQEVISFSDQLIERRRVYRTQFNVSKWPSPSRDAPQQPEFLNKEEFRARNHRIPIFTSQSLKKPAKVFDDILLLLRSHPVVDERSCVKSELAQISSEIAELELDRLELERRASKLPPSSTAAHGSSALPSQWEINQQLSKKLSPSKRSQLQNDRGRCMTVSFQNARTQDAFLTKCGCKASVLRQSTGTQRRGEETATVTVTPDNCRDGGAAATIQHISLMNGPLGSAFFISRDNGKSFHTAGRLPEQMLHRWMDAGLDPVHCNEVLYLSTGPLGYYYIEFRSGECWWGCPEQDKEFHRICKEWDVYRIVFGACSVWDDGRGKRHKASSWIVLSRDGRAAWKNIPSPLHNLLSNRMANECAPVEVALGSAGAYFVRYLDGTTDWQLPAMMADVCERLETEGRVITSISLHPELSHDFVIRHR